MKVVCRKCLLAEMNLQEVYQSVREYVEALPPDKKADEAEYARRLEICKGCENLADGMCVKCGCYVEARAAKKNADCPDEMDKWLL